MLLTADDLDAIAALIAQRDDELWSRETIAAKVDVSPRTVRAWTALPSFPKAVRLPSSKDIGQPRYYRVEVVAWIRKHKEAAL